MCVVEENDRNNYDLTKQAREIGFLFRFRGAIFHGELIHKGNVACLAHVGETAQASNYIKNNNNFRYSEHLQIILNTFVFLDRDGFFFSFCQECS